MKKRAMIFGGLVLAGSLAMGATALGAQITDSRAEDIALTHAGVDEEDVAYIFAKTDREHGKMVYEVEFLTDDYKEYDYEINAEDGTIISYDYDAEGYVNNNGNTSANVAISAEQAKQIALNKVSGATTSNIYEFKLDRDDGRYKYEGKIIYGTFEYEFEIDANTGNIIEWDRESIYD